MAARSSGDNTGLIILGLVAVGGYFAYKKIIKPDILHPLKVQQVTKQLRVYITGVKIAKGNVNFSLRVENPNSMPITIKALVGDTAIVLNGTQTIKIGNVSKYGNTVIAPTSQTEVSFSIKIEPVNFIAYSTFLLAGKVTHQAFVFSGNINIDGNTYPVKETFTIS